MSPLERLGLEVAAYNLLGSRTQAATLLCLVDADGRCVSAEQLALAKGWRAGLTEATVGTVKTRICLLRESLEDVGLHGLVRTVQPHGPRYPADGYILPEPGRSLLIERLTEEASS